MTGITLRRLGCDGPEVSAIGAGCAGFNRTDPASEEQAVRTIRAALDAGINFLNTADFYGAGQSEIMVGRAIRGRRDEAFVSVKFGLQMDPARRVQGLDGRPASVRNYASYSLRRLGIEVIDLYQPCRADPDVPYEETIGAVADLIAEGKVRHLGVSEVGADLIRRAHAVHPVTALEIEYSLASRFVEPEILPTCRELGIGVVAYRVLAEGLLTGTLPQGAPPEGAHFLAPRMQGDNYTCNVATAAALTGIAAEKGATPAQLAIAWLLAQGEDILPLAGISRPERVADTLGALDVQLGPDDLVRLDRVFAPEAIVGARYPEAVLKWAAR